jgi:hypothetical protein
VTDPKQMTEGTAEALEEMLSPRVETAGVGGETDLEKVNGVASNSIKRH